MEPIIDRFLSGDRRALARLISIVENNSQHSIKYLDQIYHRMGHAFRIGVTGPPGAGKSTLVDQLTKHYRKQDKMVGVIAIDPTSPFTGGALLGDRIRMGDLATDPGVFIRSMATRGSLGGLCERSQEVADLMDGFGFDIVILETVGVGQSELDIVEAADTTIVVLVPESGDSIQAMKAGLMEIADIFVLNKSDRSGADRFLMELESILDFADEKKKWKPPIVRTIAHSGEGIIKLYNQITNHLQFLKTTDILQKKKKKRIETYIRRIIKERLLERFWQPEITAQFHSDLDKIMHKDISPYKLSELLIEQFLDNQK